MTFSKRTIGCVLSGFVLLVFLVTCNGKKLGTAGPVQGDKNPLGKYSPPITVSTVQILNATVQFDESNPDKKSFTENRVATALLNELGIKVENKWVATDTDSNMARWNAAIASGDVPDFAWVPTNVYKLLYDADLIADMSQVFKDYASPDFIDMLPVEFFQQLTLDGKLMGFPLPTKGYHSSTVLWIRQDWLDKLGLQIPKTTDDVIALARAFYNAKLAGPDTIGIIFSNLNTGDSYGDGKWDGFANGFGAYFDYWVKKNNQLVFGEVQPEMRDALLAMQGLYHDGIMNRDMPVANAQIAQEYFASGKAGLVYSTSWMTHSTMMALHANNPNAVIINIFPPSRPGKSYGIQGNSPDAMRIFVSKKSKYPEAPVKMANLTLKWQQENYGYYMEDFKDGFQYFKYLPWNGNNLALVEADMAIGALIREAEEGNGQLRQADIIKYPGLETYYEGWKQARDGIAPGSWFLTKLWGPGGSITNIYDGWEKGLCLPNAFNGLPTETMSLKGDIINSELKAVMFDIVQGADISVWDKAVQKWHADGGQKITEEVNEWYKSVQ
jgi:putative aldouronate transport system substrate-binding protein